MAERFKAPVLKTGVGASPPWVRIPPLPPLPIDFVDDFSIPKKLLTIYYQFFLVIVTYYFGNFGFHWISHAVESEHKFFLNYEAQMRGYGSEPEDFLFHKGDWFATREAWTKRLTSAIDSMNGDELLNTSTVDLVRYLVSEYQFDVPKIYPDNLIVDQREKKLMLAKTGCALLMTVHVPSIY